MGGGAGPPAAVGAALALLLACAFGPGWWAGRCQQDLADPALAVRTIVVRHPAELDALAAEIKGSCFPYVLRLAFLNTSRWTPDHLLQHPDPWAVTVDTPIIALDSNAVLSDADAPPRPGEIPLATYFALNQTERARHYPKTSSRGYGALGFVDDFGLVFGHDEPLTPHPLFDFSGGAGHARGAGGTATLRLSSSGTVWAPHLDHSFNHVLQLHGEKAWSLFQFNQA